MLRFLRSHIHSTGDFKTADVHDFFRYSPVLQHGFPQKVTSLAHDHILGLIAIGTQNGEVRIFGAENVEWSSTTPRNLHISYMYFAAGLGALIVLCSDQSFHKFQVSDDLIVRTTANNEDRLKRITCCAMQNVREPSDARLFIGTITGNIFGLYAHSLQFSEVILFEETIAKSINATKDEVRSADQIAINPDDITKILIVFNLRKIVHYDCITNQVLHHWSVRQAITSLTWHVDGMQFICSHTDGSLDVWTLELSEPVESLIPFGPFPCTTINKIRCAIAASHPLPIKFFTGGMPRASYGDRYTLTAMREGKMVVFDFGSPVIDFFIVPTTNNNRDADLSKTLALMVLCEQELVCIDLTEKNWPIVNLPYLHPLHSSQITSVVHCSNIEEHVWKALIKVSAAQKKSDAKNKWPIYGGADAHKPSPCAATNVEKRQLLITGHENGALNLWSTGSISLKYLLTIDTAKEFEGCFGEGDCESAENDNKRNSQNLGGSAVEEDFNDAPDWPPFRKVGIYDPFCDDLRLAIQKIRFDSSSGQIVVGGRAGHVIVYDLDDEPSGLLTVCCTDFTIANCAKQSVQTSQHPLPSRRTPITYPFGYQPYRIDSNKSFMALLRPASPITAVAALHSRHLLAFASEFGFIVYDLKSQTTLISTCFLSSKEIVEAAMAASALSRFKSMKKSIRQSFRRKRKSPQDGAMQGGTGPSDENTNLEEIMPVERQIVSRTEDMIYSGSPLPSFVKVLHFFRTNILSTTLRTDSLWVGTNKGVIYAYAISDDALKPDEVCVLVKEVHLQHRAPIIDFTCATLDGSQLIKGLTGADRLIIYTEEQIKTFALPTMKPTRFRYKLTSIEGSRISKAQLITLKSSTNRKLYEKFIVIVTNYGELFLFSALTIKNCLKVNFTKASDVAGIASAALSDNGELFFLRPGGSEFQRASLAAVPHINLISPLKDSGFPNKLS